MATRRGSSSELITFLRMLPKTEEVARTLEAKAIGLAEKLGFRHQYRREGEVLPEGFFTYTPSDRRSVGAFFRKDKKLYGWRWSMKTQSAHRWTRIA